MQPAWAFSETQCIKLLRYLQGFDPSSQSLDYAVSGHWYIYTYIKTTDSFKEVA
jgi:hypothetical protein